jgi:hypothetical protein
MKTYWNNLTITNVFLNQKRVNICEKTVKIAPQFQCICMCFPPEISSFSFHSFCVICTSVLSFSHGFYISEFIYFSQNQILTKKSLQTNCHIIKIWVITKNFNFWYSLNDFKSWIARKYSKLCKTYLADNFVTVMNYLT